MKTLKLKNGVRLLAYVGDGFDGGSGFYFEQPDILNKGKEAQIPAEDIPRVVRFLKKWADAEMKLRWREGGSWRYLNRGLPSIPGTSSPYQAYFYAGHLDQWASSQRQLHRISAQHKHISCESWFCQKKGGKK